MKYSNSTILAALLLALPYSSNAQTTLTPSGNTFDLDFGGWRVNGIAPTGSTSQYDYWAGPQNVGNVVSYSGSFVAPSGYIVADGWHGTFSATATKNSGPDGNNGFFFTQNVWPATAGVDIPLGNVESSGGYSFQYAPAGTGSNAVTVTYDFSGMVNGYLPSGTPFFATDIDTGTNGEGPMVISATLASGNGHYFDYLWAGPYSNPLQTTYVPIVTWDGVDTYTLTQQNLTNSQADATVFITTQNITSLTLTSQNRASSVHALTFAAPLITVPEPSTLLFGATGLLGLLRRRRYA